jgi:hypothetical protein
MDLFLASCQGLGFALAAGLVLGVVFPPIMPNWGAIAGVVPLGVIAAGAALQGQDEALWPALPIGIVGAGLAATVARDVAAGAVRRERDQLTGAEVQAPSGVTLFVVVLAVVVAALSLLAPPASLVVLVALGWLWLSRRRREARKHEGLRVLR